MGDLLALIIALPLLFLVGKACHTNHEIIKAESRLHTPGKCYSDNGIVVCEVDKLMNKGGE